MQKILIDSIHLQINEKISKFCDDYLDEESKRICLKINNKLRQLENSPVNKGLLNNWASGIVLAFCQINFILDKSFKPYVSVKDICGYFNSVESSVNKRASTIRKLLNLNPGDLGFSTKFALNNLFNFKGSIKRLSSKNALKDGSSAYVDSNVLIEALGCGKQTIIMEKSMPHYNKFLLYPKSTVSKIDVKKDFKSFQNDYLYPNGESGLYEVKYYAEVVDVLKKPKGDYMDFLNYQIFTKKHLSNYYNKNLPYIWILRVYKLDNSHFLNRKSRLKFCDVHRPIELKGKAVIPDYEFLILKNELLNI